MDLNEMDGQHALDLSARQYRFQQLFCQVAKTIAPGSSRFTFQAKAKSSTGQRRDRMLGFLQRRHVFRIDNPL